jgi:hypothetical protein
MKKVITKVIMGFVLTSIPFALTAKDDIYNLPAYGVAEIETLPVPIERSIPVVSSGLVGTTIRIKLTVDEFGISKNIESARPLFSLGTVNEKERDFAVQMSQAVAYWEFQPAFDTNGKPVESTVIMPVTVIERDGVQQARVAVILENNFRKVQS